MNAKRESGGGFAHLLHRHQAETPTASGDAGQAASDRELDAAVQERTDVVTDELELPPVTVAVDHGIATVEGDVSDQAEADIIEEAAAATPGITGVVSHLASTMPRPPSDALPNTRSRAMHELVAAAAAAGCGAVDDVEAVRIVLQMFFRALPAWERQHLLSSLPDDVRESAGTPTGIEHAIRIVPADLRAMEDAVAAFVGLRRKTAHEAVVSIVQTLHAVLPPDRRSIAARLPSDLADVWCVLPSRSPGSQASR